MKRWLGGALLGCLSAAGLAAWWVEREPPPPAPAPAPPMAEPAPVRLPPPVSPSVAPAASVASLASAVAPLDSLPGQPSLTAQEAQVLMQLMLERGDPRSPPLGGLKAREQAPPAALADPAQYQAFEDRHSRALVQAYARGVQQIPSIRARIEQAAQSGERNATELDEARAALEQLEMLQGKLQREAPELLPKAP